MKIYFILSERIRPSRENGRCCPMHMHLSTMEALYMAGFLERFDKARLQSKAFLHDQRRATGLPCGGIGRRSEQASMPYSKGQRKKSRGIKVQYIQSHIPRC